MKQYATSVQNLFGFTNQADAAGEIVNLLTKNLEFVTNNLTAFVDIITIVTSYISRGGSRGS